MEQLLFFIRENDYFLQYVCFHTEPLKNFEKIDSDDIIDYSFQ